MTTARWVALVLPAATAIGGLYVVVEAMLVDRGVGEAIGDVLGFWVVVLALGVILWVFRANWRSARNASDHGT